MSQDKIRLLSGSIAQSTIRTSIVLSLRLTVQAGILLLVTRMLGPEQFGAFAGVTAMAVLMGTFSSFGTSLVLLGEVSKDIQQRERVLSYAIPTTLIVGSLLLLTYLSICLHVLSEVALPISVVACIGVTETILLPLFVLPVTVQLALERTAGSQLLLIMPLALRMSGAVCVILVAPVDPLTMFAWLYMLTGLLALFLVGFCDRSAWLPVKQWRLASKEELRQSAGYAVLAITAMAPGELDKMLAVKLLPLGVSGLYSAASRIVGAATLPVIALLLSVMPKLFRNSEKEPIQNRRLMNWIFASVLLYGVVLSGLLWAAAPVIEWMFGQQYVGLKEMMTWLCVAAPGLALRMAVGNVLMSANKAWMRAAFELCGILILVVSSVMCCQYFGGKGMALAVTLSEWSMAVIGLYLALSRKLPCSGGYYRK